MDTLVSGPMILFKAVMDVVYENSVAAIQGLQDRFLQQSDVFFMISNVFDPRYAFLVYSPLFFGLDWRVGKKIMWVSVVAEWLNQLLKWTLHGERPYWWIHETHVYNKTGISMPDIHQFHMTCETGPGSPSGHAMVTAAVFYVILDSYLRKYNHVKKEGSTSAFGKVCWVAYLLLLAIVSASRVFIAAHFPHQCLFGIAIGWMVARAMDNINQRKLGLTSYCAMTAFMLSSALSMYSLLHAIGVDPMWSVERALKWCAKREYVHLDTSPFFSMVRYCGFLFGMGFGFASDSFKKGTSSKKASFGERAARAALAVAICKMSERIDFPKTHMGLFYVQAFLMNSFLAYSMIALAPSIVSKIFKEKTH